MYIPKYFKLYELLPKDFYESNDLGSKLWLIFDDRVLWTIDRLRENYGLFTMNDWHWGGTNQYRGWRPFDCKIGAFLSQHKFGRAGDGKFRDVPTEEVRKEIKEKDQDIFRYITAIEDDVSWLHFDTRNHDKQKYGLLIV